MTTRQPTYDVRSFQPGLGLAYIEFTTDGSKDPLALTNNGGGLVSAIASITYGSGIYTIVLASGHKNVIGLPVILGTTGFMVGNPAVFSEPSTLKIQLATDTSTPDGYASARIGVLCVVMSQ